MTNYIKDLPHFDGFIYLGYREQCKYEYKLSVKLNEAGLEFDLIQECGMYFTPKKCHVYKKIGTKTRPVIIDDFEKKIIAKFNDTTESGTIDSIYNSKEGKKIVAFKLDSGKIINVSYDTFEVVI